MNTPNTPTYKQVWGIAANTGHPVRSFRLNPDKAWALDVEDLYRQVNEETKIIALVNPNNPTGHILTEQEINEIVAVADKVLAIPSVWINISA